ncbi:conserved hypothetical protein [Culex quinquefasciatus]|uniref:Uncharacterized protein n=1 Tax=Culex quinquefasciatus TaxID=7176 RepID=B0WIL7_CULQU|nr:conserved hypothetical protein [Culex quinquefasciatus]|eukprot:XP_001848551.1 conserved hypothetical protein [Culex quinquefasciatus]
MVKDHSEEECTVHCLYVYCFLRRWLETWNMNVTKFEIFQASLTSRNSTIESPMKPAQRAGWMRQYPKSANGPIVVLIRQLDIPIKFVSLADTINRYYPTVLNISKQNRYTVKIVLTDRDEANHLTNNPTFTSSHRVYVPCHNVEIDGIVYEPGLNPKDLLKHGQGKFKNPDMESVPIVRCNQLAKFSALENKYIPANGMRITFAGTVLPDFVEYKRVISQYDFLYRKSCTVKDAINTDTLQSYAETLNGLQKPCALADCSTFKAMALKLKNQHKETSKNNYLAATTGQEQQQQGPKKPIQTQSCDHPTPQQKPSSKVTPFFTLSQLISLICDAAGIKDDWRETINVAMPF